ncbi:MAG: DUF91 domain-containing protein [Nannocystis sp.]|nr:DUF91 domain-containing protein [Nannocystis sp.]
MKENVIRDKLAANLSVLEAGLTLLKVEPHLPDSLASGFIDILARDRMGLLVLIELKRSDSAARQAIQELFKYISLVVRNFGVPRSKIRCLIVSTTWRELWNPFSELKLSADIQVEGLELTVADDGSPLVAHPVQPPPAEEDRGVCSFYPVVCYESAADRDAAADQIAEGMKTSGFLKGAVVLQNYEGPDQAMIYPYSITAVVGALAVSAGSQSVDRESGADDRWHQEIELISTIVGNARKDTSSEQGGVGPEQFVGRLHSGWRCVRLMRVGSHWRDSAIFDDGTILEITSGFQSRNAIYFEAIASPRHHQDWKQRLGQLKDMLDADGELQELLEARLTEFSQRSPRGAVSLHVFYPDDLLRAFYGPLLSRPRDGMEPGVQLWLDPQDGSEPSALYGLLCWAPKRETYDLCKLVETAYDGLTGYFLACALHEHYPARAAILHGTDMHWRVFEHFSSQGESRAFQLRLKGRVLDRVQIGEGSFGTVSAFINSNWNSVCDLAELIGRYTSSGTVSALRVQIGASEPEVEDDEEIHFATQSEACQICKRSFGDVMFDAHIPELGGFGLICRHCFIFRDCRLGVGSGQMYIWGSDRWQLVAGGKE